MSRTGNSKKIYDLFMHTHVQIPVPFLTLGEPSMDAAGQLQEEASGGTRTSTQLPDSSPLLQSLQTPSTDSVEPCMRAIMKRDLRNRDPRKKANGLW